jgi:hypothetical protein
MLSTGQQCAKTHNDRSLAAAKFGLPDNLAQSTLRILKAASSRGVHILFHRL